MGWIQTYTIQYNVVIISIFTSHYTCRCVIITKQRIYLHRCWSSPTSADLPLRQPPLQVVASYPSLLIDRLWNIHTSTSTATSIMTIDHSDFIHSFIHTCMHVCLYVYISMLIKTAEVVRGGHSAMYVRIPLPPPNRVGLQLRTVLHRMKTWRCKER